LVKPATFSREELSEDFPSPLFSSLLSPSLPPSFPRRVASLFLPSPREDEEEEGEKREEEEEE